MGSIISMFRQLMHDKRGEARILFGPTIGYKATSPKHEKLARQLSQEMKSLDFLCLETTSSIGKIKMAALGTLLDVPAGLLNFMAYIISAGKSINYGDKVINRISKNYYRREKIYNKKVKKALKKGQIQEVSMIIDLDRPAKEFEYD